MNFTLNSYATVLLAFGLLTLLLALVLLKRLTVASKWFGVNMVSTAWWAITYSFELSCSSFDSMKFWVNLEYLGIAMIPVSWIIFIIFFTGREKWITKRNVAMLVAIPLLTLVLVWTNPFHHWHYKQISIDNSGAFPMLDLRYGFWYKVFTTYVYLLLAAGGYLLLITYKKQDSIYKRQRNVLLIAVLIPWVANLLYLIGIRPQQHIDITPYAFIASALVVFLGLVRLNLFDLVPVAREKIIEEMRDGVLVIDHYKRVIDVNGQMKKILCWPASEKIIGLKLFQVITGENSLYKVITNKEDAKLELQRKVDDTLHYFEVDVTPLIDKEQNHTGAIILFRDITQRKLSDEQLNEQSRQLNELNQLKDRLFSVISHDLRSPIINLTLLVDMMDNGLITDEEFKKFIPTLSKRLTYTSNLLENLLHWSKTQMKGYKIERTHFDLKALAANDIQYLRNKALEKGIEVKDAIPEDSIVFADANMVELVLRNLLSNAIKFSSEGDLITVDAIRGQDMQMTVCVKDTGSGMPAEMLDKLFVGEPFSTPGTNNEKGTGLGLQLCKDFVERNGGSIWVESEPGMGSSIYFTLPLNSNVPGNLVETN